MDARGDDEAEDGKGRSQTMGNTNERLKVSLEGGGCWEEEEDAEEEEKA